MNSQRGALPTLTEVIEVGSEIAPAPAQPAALPAESLPLEAVFTEPVVAGAALTAQVLEAMRPRIDAMLESRLREVLAPQLAQLADAAMQSMRSELTSAMHALVVQAVEEVLERRR